MFTDQAKNLGVLIDHKLKFTNHVTNITKRAFCNLKLIYSNRHLLNKECRTLLCESLVLSHLNYGDVVYGPNLLLADSRRLQLIQNSCIRLICGLRRGERVSMSRRDLGWLNMEKRRHLHCLTFYHKIITSKKPAYLFKKLKFRTSIHNLNVRFKNLLTPPQHRTTQYRGSFSYNITKQYNKLNDNLKTKNLAIFKYRLKQMLLIEND